MSDWSSDNGDFNEVLGQSHFATTYTKDMQSWVEALIVERTIARQKHQKEKRRAKKLCQALGTV